YINLYMLIRIGNKLYHQAFHRPFHYFDHHNKNGKKKKTLYVTKPTQEYYGIYVIGFKKVAKSRAKKKSTGLKKGFSSDLNRLRGSAFGLKRNQFIKHCSELENSGLRISL
ncbi:hypothetical protein PanWU01x14_000770, partial [Parasponia andersonii]